MILWVKYNKPKYDIKMLTSMDNLRSLMECLDDISKMIPEGTYLEMCDNIKKVHATIPKNDDPPMTDNRRVPFQPIQNNNDSESESETESESESEDDSRTMPGWYDEWAQNEEGLRIMLRDIRIVKARLNTLNPIQRISRKVRDAAMRHFTSYTPIFDIDIFEQYEMNEATFDDYVRLTDFSNWSFTDRKEFTSKKFERKIYADYKMYKNYQTEVIKNELLESKRVLEIEISDMRDRQDYLRVHHNL